MSSILTNVYIQRASSPARVSQITFDTLITVGVNDLAVVAKCVLKCVSVSDYKTDSMRLHVIRYYGDVLFATSPFEN